MPISRFVVYRAPGGAVTHYLKITADKYTKIYTEAHIRKPYPLARVVITEQLILTDLQGQNLGEAHV